MSETEGLEVEFDASDEEGEREAAEVSEDELTDEDLEKETERLAGDDTEEDPEEDPEEEEKSQADKQAGAFAALRRSERTLKRRMAMIEQAIAEAILEEESEEAEMGFPDIDEDPEGHVAARARFEAQRLRMEAEMQARKEAEVAEMAREHSEAISAHVDSSREAFAREQPDYMLAEDWLANQIASDLRESYPGAPEDAIKQEFDRQVMGLQAQCAERNVDYGAHLYDMAKRRGWTPDMAEGVVGKTQGRMAKARGLAGSGAARSKKSGKVNISAMSDDEFSEWMDKVGESGFKKAASKIAT